MSTPVLQLLNTPYSIDPGAYANALSASNPEGDYLAAYRLRTLVDPAPSFAPNYDAAGSTETTYGVILEAASGGASGSLLSDLISAARQRFTEVALENVGGAPGTWRAVAVGPADWTSPEAAFVLPRSTLRQCGLAALQQIFSASAQAACRRIGR